ncbi:unnamed protein product, partial [Citrullus colocynthis]
ALSAIYHSIWSEHYITHRASVQMCRGLACLDRLHNSHHLLHLSINVKDAFLMTVLTKQCIVV